MRINKVAIILICLVILFGTVVRVGYWRESSPTQSIDCVEKGTCRPSYRNTAVCEELRVGTPEKQLIFRLGKPLANKGNSLFFEAGATEPGPIEVKLDDQRNAMQFVCRPGF